MNFERERREVAYYMRRLYRQKLTTTSGGNISLRLDEATVAITPSVIDKGRIRTAEIALINQAGTNLSPDLTPSIETQMHLCIYAQRPDVNAIVHAHPVTATAFSAAKTVIDCELIAESYALLGAPALAPYAIMGSDELAQLVAEKVKGAEVILLENHGVVTLGDSLLRAFDRLELIEAAAQMTLIARQLEGVQRLKPEWKRELDRMMGRKPPEESKP